MYLECVRACSQLCLALCIPWTAAHQAALSLGFPRQEYWSGSPFPAPGDLPDSGIEVKSRASVGGFFPSGPPVASECP